MGMYRPIFLGLAISALGLAACQQQNSPRNYTEVVSQSPAGKKPAPEMAMNASPVDVKIDWHAPAHWVMKDSANGMRDGSYGIPDSAVANTGELNPEAVDVSISHFAGNAGGLARNVERWMGQVGLRLDSAGMDAFLAKAARFTTQTGDSGIVIDLTTMLSGDMTQDKTIFGAVVPGSGYTLFVKAMGEKSRVIAAKADIEAFCKTLQLKSAEP
jgi:hypothetical protein